MFGEKEPFQLSSLAHKSLYNNQSFFVKRFFHFMNFMSLEYLFLFLRIL